MKAIVMPAQVLCGACGGVMFMRRHAATQAAQLQLYCLSLSCPERRRTYIMDLDVRELKATSTMMED